MQACGGWTFGFTLQAVQYRAWEGDLPKELGQLKDDDEANKDGEDPEGKKKAADPKAKADSSKKKKTKENGAPPKKKQKLSSLEECSFNTCP